MTTEPLNTLEQANKVLEAKCKELENENLAYKKENNIISHKILTCGVAATHPDKDLSKRESDYGGKWDSPQAQEVRKLRDSHADITAKLEKMREALQEVALYTSKNHTLQHHTNIHQIVRIALKDSV